MKARSQKAKRTEEELTEGLEHKKVVCELPEGGAGLRQVRQHHGEDRKKFVCSKLVIVPAQVYVTDYYVASYKYVYCEGKTGESYIRQAEVPVLVMQKSVAVPSTV